MPTLSIKEGAKLEVVYKIKLVGLVVTSDIRWNEHVNYAIQQVNRTLWQLTRFKQLGADRDKLVLFYILKIRSILMFGAVCYHSALTLDQRHKLELQ